MRLTLNQRGAILLFIVVGASGLLSFFIPIVILAAVTAGYFLKQPTENSLEEERKKSELINCEGYSPYDNLE